MPSTLMDLPRVHVSNRGGLEGIKRKQRFAPLRHGKLILARMDVSRIPGHQGLFAWSDTGRSVTIGVKVTVVSGNQAGRFFWIQFSRQGNLGKVGWSEEQLKAMMDCLRASTGSYPPIEKMVDEIDGRVFPIYICQEPHWKHGKTVNNIHALSPNPEHLDFDCYYDLIKKLGGQVPGVTLYPESRALQLLESRRKAANDVREDGFTLAERRKQQGKAQADKNRRLKPQLDLADLLMAG